MATRGFENITEAEIAQRNRRIGGRGVHAEAEIAQAAPAKTSKYHAEACIVTDDLTLFSEADIRKLASGRVGADSKAPLKNIAATVNVRGRLFQSLKEGRRFIELAQMQKAGEIQLLQLQVSYPLCVQPLARPIATIGEYRLDFQYERDGRLHHEDAKGMRTQLYKWKKAHCEAQYGITIVEL